MKVKPRNFFCSIITFCLIVTSLFSNLSFVYAEDTNNQVSITVGKGGSYNYQTIQEAVDSINITPSENKRVNIYIAKGIYEESVIVDKPYISFINAETNNADDVVITYNKSMAQKDNYQSSKDLKDTAVLFIDKNAVGFTAKNITVRNSFNLNLGTEDKKGSEIISSAVAAAVFSDKVTFENCNFISRENTIYLNGASLGNDVYGRTDNARTYLKNCKIEGTYNFIIGDATAVFDNCNIIITYFNENDISVIKPETTLFNLGFVFLNSEFTINKSANNLEAEKTENLMLINPSITNSIYQNYGSHTAFINCKIPSEINNSIYNIEDKDILLNKLRIMEYNSYDEIGNTIDLSQRPDFVKILTPLQAQSYTALNILRGEDNWNVLNDEKFDQDSKVNTADITLNSYEINIPKGESFKIKPFIIPFESANKSYKMISENTDIADIDEEGNIIGLKEGKAQINVTIDESGFSALLDVTVISERTSPPNVEDITIESNETIYPGDILRGKYNYSLKTDNEIDNAKLQWFSVNPITGESTLLKEGNNQQAKEYKVTTADIGNKIKFVVIPQTLTSYEDMGEEKSYTTKKEVSEVKDGVIAKTYLREFFNNFDEKKYYDKQNDNLNISSASAVWIGSSISNDDIQSFEVTEDKENSYITGKGKENVIIEYNSNNEAAWQNVSLNLHMRVNPEIKRFDSESGYNIYTSYNGLNNSYYKLNMSYSSIDNSFTFNLYKKSGYNKNEFLLDSETKIFTDKQIQEFLKTESWFNVILERNNDNISALIKPQLNNEEIFELSAVDENPIQGGFTAVELFGKTNTFFIDSIFADEILNNDNLENANITKVYIAGDSVSKTYENGETTGGFGEYLQNYFDINKVKVINKSEENESSKTFIKKGKLKEITEQIKSGDYLFIQFGHYDSYFNTETYTDTGVKDDDGNYPILNNTFKWYLKQYIDVARQKGAVPVLITPVSEMKFNDEGKIISHIGEDDSYVNAVKQIAQEENVQCIDLFSKTKEEFEKAGVFETEKMHDFSENGEIDTLNLSKYGADFIAGIFADELKKSNIEIKQYLTQNKQNPVSQYEGFKNSTVYVAGDIFASDYEDDGNYSLLREGYGKYLQNYFNDNITVKNLSLSDKSSKSFVYTDNYKNLSDNIKSGDYLLIQFAYNDGINIKSEDKNNNYTEPLKDKDTKDSFKYHLYKDYIKLAQDKNAYPILVTPPVTRNFNEEGAIIDTYSLYEYAIKDLAKELNLPVVDLSDISKQYYINSGQENTKSMYALYKDKTTGEKGIDNIHYNKYGADICAKMITEGLKNTPSSLKKYVDYSKENKNTYITRADFIVQLLGLINGKEASDDNFNDISSGKYYTQACSIAKQIGLASGDKEGNFNPEKFLTRQDMIVFTARLLRDQNHLESSDTSVLYRFNDLNYIEPYARKDIADAVNAQIIDGKDGYLNVSAYATKEDAAKIIYKVYDMLGRF